VNWSNGKTIEILRSIAKNTGRRSPDYPFLKTAMRLSVSIKGRKAER